MPWKEKDGNKRGVGGRQHRIKRKKGKGKKRKRKRKRNKEGTTSSLKEGVSRTSKRGGKRENKMVKGKAKKKSYCRNKMQPGILRFGSQTEMNMKGYK